MIDQIATGKKTVSAQRAKQIDRLTNGQVPAHVLRPDIFDPPPEPVHRKTRKQGRQKQAKPQEIKP